MRAWLVSWANSLHVCTTCHSAIISHSAYPAHTHKGGLQVSISETWLRQQANMWTDRQGILQSCYPWRQLLGHLQLCKMAPNRLPKRLYQHTVLAARDECYHMYMHQQRVCTCGQRASLLAQRVNNEPATQMTWVWSLSREDPLEKGIATNSSLLAWRIPLDRGAWWAYSPRGRKSRTRTSS